MSEEQIEEQLLMRRTFRVSLDVTIEIKDNTKESRRWASNVSDVQERLWLQYYIQDQKDLLDALLANPEIRDLFLQTLVLRKVESVPEAQLQKELVGAALEDEEILGAILATLPDVAHISFQNSDKGWSLSDAVHFHNSFSTEITKVALSEITEPGIEKSGIEESDIEESDIEDAQIEDAQIEDAQIEDAQIEDAQIEENSIEEAETEESGTGENQLEEAAES